MFLHHSRPRVLLACGLAMFCLHPHQQAHGDENGSEAVRHLIVGKKLTGQGKQEEAEEEFRAAVASATETLGAEKGGTLMCRDYLAEALLAQKKYTEAEAEYRAVLAIRVRTRGPDGRLTLATAFKLASVLFTENKIAEARAVLLPAYERFRAIAQPNDPALEPFKLLARALEQKGAPEEKK